MALTKISTDGVKDDAVTTDKLANAINTERTANTAKVSTTINNNADNRVITGSGTANTLNGESNVVVDANGKLGVGTSSPDSLLHVYGATTGYAKIETGDGSTNPIIMHKNPDRTWHAGLRGDTSDSYVIRDATASANRLAIDSSGNVGIGTSSPNSFTNYTTLTINGGSAGAGIDLELSDNNIYGRFFADTTGIQITAAQSGDSIRFETDGGNVRARITDDGLCFGSDTAAANALDDYEEGTFSPTVTQGGSVSSYGTQIGRYIKIGRQVHWQIYMAMTGTGNGDGLKIGSFPFTSATYNTHGYGGGTMGYAANTFQTDNMYMYFEQNSTDLTFRERDGTIIAGNSGNIFGNADFILFGQYISAS